MKDKYGNGKMVRRIFAVLLTVCLLFSLSVSAVANDVPGGTGTEESPAPNTGSLTITKAMANATYKVYKMLDIVGWTLDGTDHDKVTSSVYYLTNTSAWKDFFVDSAKSSGDVTAAGVKNYVLVTTSGELEPNVKDDYYVEWIGMKKENGEQVIDDVKVEAFAKLALEYARDSANSVNPAQTATAPAKKEGSAQSIEVTFTDLPFGYYLVDTNGGTVISIDTHASNQTIEEKNTAPTLEKKVQDERDGSEGDKQWQEENTASIGDTVNFKSSLVYMIDILEKRRANGYE